MISDDHHEILEAAIRIILEDGRISMTFSRREISISLPTTRRLADYLGIPHYYVLPRFAAMEKDGLIRRAERVGISTTQTGTEAFITLIEGHYPDAFRTILPEGLLEVIQSVLNRREEG
jgi:DNA-binding transcriptional regulator YhcF (GntR family)